MSKHQEAMAAKRTALTVIRDAYVVALRKGPEDPYFGPFADALRFALRMLRERPLGKGQSIPTHRRS